MVLLVGLSAFAFAGFCLWLARKEWPLLDTLVGAFLLLAAQVLSVEMLLAALGHLTPWPVATVHLVLTGAVWARIGRDVPASARWIWRELRTIAGSMTWYSWTALALMAVMSVWVLGLAVYSPELSWDGNMYHVPIAAARMQQGNLERIASSWKYVEAYPEASELFIVWNVLFLKSQALADAVQLPFWLFGTLAVISLATKMGARLPYAVLGSMLWMFAPVAALQAGAAGNDLIVASLFWMGMNSVYQRPVSPFSVSLVGIAAGLMLGTKYTAAWSMAVLGLFALWTVFRAPNRRALTVPLLVAWIGFGLLNSTWYLSNWRHTGNPIWPLDFSAGPIALKGDLLQDDYEEWFTPRLLAGKPRWQQTWLVWLEPDSYYQEDAKLTGFGPLWIVLGVPAILSWAVLDRKGWPIILASLLILALQPVAWHTRFALFVPGLGAVALAVVLSRLRVVAKGIAVLVLAAGAVFSFLAVVETHKLGFVWMPSAYRTQVYSGWQPLDGAYRWLDSNTRTPTTVIYGSYIAFPAPLWGEDLRHSVTYIRPVDRESWERAVLDQETEWAFVAVGSWEDQVLENSSRFLLTVDDRRMADPEGLQTRIYRAVKERGAE